MRFDPATSRQRGWRIPKARIRVNDDCVGFATEIAIDSHDRILLTFGGYAELKRFDPATSRWESFLTGPIGSFATHRGSHLMVLIDDEHVALSGAKVVKPGNIGIRRYFGILDLRSKKLRLSKAPGQFFTRMPDRTLAYGSNNGQVGIFDPANGKFRALIRSRNTPMGVEIDRRGRLWAWEEAAGPLIVIVDPVRQTSQTFVYPVYKFIAGTDPSSPLSCPPNGIISVRCDPNRLWTVAVDSSWFVTDGYSTGWLVTEGFRDPKHGGYPTLYRLTVP